MAQYSNGQLRLAVKESDGRLKSASPAAQYDLWDNASAPRIVFADRVEGTAQGTSDDQIVTPPADLYATGSDGELLDLELLHTAAATTITTASHVCRLNVADIYQSGGRLRIVDRILTVGDRFTKDTSGTQSGPNGWKDDTKNVPYVWSPMLRFKPEAGHVYAPRGHQYAVIDGA